jgi:CubicO group peptidase (beta-lactamase class C family)
MTTINTAHPALQPTADPALVERANAAVEATIARHRIPGMSLAITSPDRLLFAAGFGDADLANGVPATESTQYLWFSLTKIATATAAMRLVDLGQLDLHQPVAELVPGYRTGRSPSPTVRQLLNHTAGFANPIPVRWVRPAAQPAPDPREFLASLLARHGTPKYAIGGAARYSNLGYLMLAEVIAEAAGRPFTEVLTDTVLRPLRMEHTGFTHPGEPLAAVGYVKVPRVVAPVLRRLLPAGVVGPRVGRYTSLHPFLVNGAGYGGLVGDVVDAARLAAMHLADGTLDGQRILAPETARMMRNITAPGNPFDVGLGWFRKPAARNTTAVEHLGAGGGFFNAMRIYPELQLGMVAMANTTTAWDHATLFDELATTVTLMA